jgi:hypothetical protein
MIKKKSGFTVRETAILICLMAMICCIWLFPTDDSKPNGKYGVALNTKDITMSYSDKTASYLLSNISCTKQTVSLYRGKECLVYTIDTNSSYYIPANVVFDRIESEPIKISDYVTPFGTKVVK